MNQNKWNVLDKFIRILRVRNIKKYVPHEGIVLDIGCGQEAYLLNVIKNKILKGYGCDFKIKNYTNDNLILFNNKNKKTLDVPSNECDVVFLIAVLEHLENPKDIITEITRVLKSGGKLVLTTPTKLAKPILEFMAFKLQIINKEEILEHVHYYNKNEILKLFNDNYNKENFKYKKFLFGMNSKFIIEKL